MTDDQTPLDLAHASMLAAPDDDTARLRFYERLADGELFLLLSGNASGDNISPQVFEVEDQAYVLAFDRETRLSGFVGQPAPYAALSGRSIAAMLAPQTMGLGLNLDVAPSAMLIPPQAVVWLHQTLGQAPDQVLARPQEIFAPRGLPEVLITALDTKLATAGGFALSAYLVGVQYEDGRRGHLLAFVDAKPGAETALSQAANEALIFSGIDAGTLDVGFFQASDQIAALLAKSGLRFDLPPAQTQTTAPLREAPGSNPEKPPILR